MYDEIICECPLPNNPPAFVGPGYVFQTKALDCSLSHYVITANGELRCGEKLVEVTGAVDFGASNVVGWHPAIYTKDGEPAESVEYVAFFDRGKLVEIKEVSRERQFALPASKMRRPPPFPRPTAEQIAEWKKRESESLIGRTVFVLWGGQENFYPAKIVAEDRRHYCAQKPDGDLETLYRSDRDRIIFDTEAEAIEEVQNRANEAKQQREQSAADAAEYEEAKAKALGR